MSAHADDAQRRAADPRHTAWVAASAGTGKTKVLVDRLLGLLLDGVAPHRLLCLTFTRAAATEMANRIATALADWTTADADALEAALTRLSGAPPEAGRVARARQLFARVLDAPGGLPIMTIHAFCQSLLQRFPIEAGVPPHFEVLDEAATGELLAEARNAVLAAAQAGTDASLADALRYVTDRLDEDSVQTLLTTLLAQRVRLEHLVADAGGTGPGDVGPLLARTAARLGVDPAQQPADVIAAGCRDSAFDGAALAAAAAALEAGSKTDGRRGAAIRDWLAAGDRRSAGFAAYRDQFLTREGIRRASLATKAVRDSAPAALEVLEAEADRIEALVAAARAHALYHRSAALVALGAAVSAAYAAEKERRGRLDYGDLIDRGRALLDRAEMLPWIMFKLDGGIDHVLIDEAQDTSPEQWSIVRRLTAEFFAGEGARPGPRTVFAVGDRKQSIYSFQGADPDAFEASRRHFARRAREAEQPFLRVDLEVSFRSSAPVLETVDAVFAPEPARRGVAARDETVHHRVSRTGMAGRVELWPVVEPVEAEARPAWSLPSPVVSGEPPPQRLAAAIARVVAGWLGRGERLEARDRPVRAGDIMILVRRRGQFMDAMVRALKAAGVPVAGADRMALTDNLAVMDLMALGDCLLLPEDDLTLATVLKGPLIGMSEDELLALAHGRPGSLWAALAAAPPDSPAGRAHARLEALRRRADFTPPHELYADLLGAGGGRRALVARLGHEAEDPIEEFLNAALAVERLGPASLQGFLAHLRHAGQEIKRESGDGRRDEVRVMTVHGAKGLEAPVVFLPDTRQPPRPQDVPPLLWPDGAGIMLWSPSRADDDAVAAAARGQALTAQSDEYRRLLYVAMTRAADRLYVCGWDGARTPPAGNWYELVADGLAGMAGVTEIDAATIDPALTGTALRYETPQRTAPRPDRRLAGDAPDAGAPDWLERPAPAEPTPARPLAPSRPETAEPAPVSPLDAAGDRFRRGLLVHRLLELLPDLAPASRRAAALRFLSRPAHGLDPDRAAALCDEVLAVLDDPAFAALWGPGSLAEVALTGRIGSRVVSGRVDRLVVLPDSVLIVDYKTNRPPAATPEAVAPAYLAQLAGYRAALAAIYPDRPAGAALLWTDGPRLMPIPPELLDRATPQEDGGAPASS